MAERREVFELETGHKWDLIQIGAEEMERLQREYPFDGVPVFFADFAHKRPDTGQLTGLVLTKVWPHVKGTREPDGKQVGQLYGEGDRVAK